ncbi:30S ribosomal protein S13 [Candidatus Micrarchaeota archaeon]|nr:30S ribosomal protein S13 [Candidatus Micrarchaeota archaeon]
MASGKKEAKEPKEHKEPKEAKKAPPPAVKKGPAKPERENFRGIVRIAGKDMKGEVPLRMALLRVRGIGHTLSVSVSNIINEELSIDPYKEVGELSEEQIEKIDHILQTVHHYKIPLYLFNRRGDYRSGTDKHVIMNDLIFENTQDVEREKKLYTWKGYRHAYGQKVRGQRTRNTGRTGMAVGVLRKSIIAAQTPQGAVGGAPAKGASAPAGAPAVPAAKAAAAPAKKEEKK